MKGHQDSCGAGSHGVQGEAEPLGFVWPGEKKAKERLHLLHLYTKCVVTVEMQPKDKGMEPNAVRV